MSSAPAIWHDLECGGYRADLPLWRTLAADHGDPVLEIGAGTGRVSLDLAAAGHEVLALDHDERLLIELNRRSDGLRVRTVVADARAFALENRFATCLVPMQAIQLLGASRQRRAFLRCAKRHLLPGGVLAIAIVEALDCYELADGRPAPLPDICEREGVLYCSQPTAIRSSRAGFVLERRRETISPSGRRRSERDVIQLARVTVGVLEREIRAVGLLPSGRIEIPQTAEYSGSVVVVSHA
jgi:SAM-dependent methyltransferase